MFHLGDVRRSVCDGETVDVGGSAWTLLLPANLRGGSQLTKEDRAAGPLRLELVVSSDGDEVRRSVLVHGQQRQELRVRRHTHLLLELVEARLSDVAAGLPAADQGWVDAQVLCRRLGLTPSLLHLRTHRARAQLDEACEVGRIIEDRGERSRRQLRIAIEDVAVKTVP